MQLELLTPSGLEGFRRLLGAPDFGGCFCAVWTGFAADWQARCSDPAQPNYHHTARDLAGGRHVGYLVREGEDLVAWTGAGPKPAFPLLATKLGSRLSPATVATWSIGCLAVSQAWRGRGLGEAIVRAVTAEARRSGAECVEAYPVRPFHEPRAYRGSPELYARLGFVEAGAERDGEHEVLLMRLSLPARA